METREKKEEVVRTVEMNLRKLDNLVRDFPRFRENLRN